MNKSPGFRAGRGLIFNYMETSTYKDFEKLEIRVGTIVKAEEFPDARKPAYKLWIDFGSFGTRKTSAQITQLYDLTNLVGRQVVAVTNFPPKQVGKFVSECLVLGGVGEAGQVVLLQPERSVENGLRVL